MRSLAPGLDRPAVGPAGVPRDPAGLLAPNSLARWGGRRLGFPTPFPNHLSREPILDGLLSDEAGLATLVPEAGNEPPELGRLLANLWVRSGLRNVRRFEVRGLRVTIGSHPANHVVLDSPHVAARHAVLSLAGGVWSLASLEAVGDTWVDGVRVEESLALAPGSEVRVAGVVLSFAPRDRWSDSPVLPGSDRSVPALSGPLFLSPEETGQPRRPIVRAAVVLIVCLLAYLLLGVR